MSTGDTLSDVSFVLLVILIILIIHVEIIVCIDVDSLYCTVFFARSFLPIRTTSPSFDSARFKPSSPVLLSRLCLWRLLMSIAEVLIKAPACRLCASRCKAYSTTGARIAAPWCFLLRHIFSVELSGTSLSSLKPLHYWSWAEEAIQCRCSCSQGKGCLQLLPWLKTTGFQFGMWILLPLLELHKLNSRHSPCCGKTTSSWLGCKDTAEIFIKNQRFCL